MSSTLIPANNNAWRTLFQRCISFIEAAACFLIATFGDHAFREQHFVAGHRGLSQPLLAECLQKVTLQTHQFGACETCDDLTRKHLVANCDRHVLQEPSLRCREQVNLVWRNSDLGRQFPAWKPQPPTPGGWS
jgi:hypothetical protein